MDNMVSFIIPVLNGEKFIKQCIDNIIQDMHVDDEIIVVDNGSTDNTLQIVKQYKQIEILKFPGLTISALRNRGANIAKGDILAFIDSDCVLCDGWRKSVDLVMKNRKISATGSRYDIPQFAKWIEKAWYSKRRKKPSNVNYINSGNLVVRKEVFVAVGGFNEKLITDEDCDIGMRLKYSGYCLTEAPHVRVIHLGNPKTLREFYKKEKWHATSMLSSSFPNKIDKPFVMTILFMFCTICSIFLLPLILLDSIYMFVSLILLIFVPLLTSLYRILQFKNYRVFFHLIILYFLYFAARASILSKVLLKKYFSWCS